MRLLIEPILKSRMVVLTNGARIIRESSIGDNKLPKRSHCNLLLPRCRHGPVSRTVIMIIMVNIAEVLPGVLGFDLFIRSSLVSLK